MKPNHFFDAVKTVTFDVGYTIIFPSESVGTSYQRELAKHGYDLCPDRLENSFFQSWLRHVTESQGLIYGTTEAHAVETWSKLLQNMLTHFPSQQFCPKTVSTAARNIYDNFASAGAWKIHPNWENVFRLCKQQGWKVGLLSNWDLRLRKLLEELGLSRMVDFQVISAEHGVEKPDFKIFQTAADKAGCKVSEILHVGDTFIDDVIGAVEAGAKAVWCNHREQEVDPRLAAYAGKAILVNDLSELLSHLGQSC